MFEVKNFSGCEIIFSRQLIEVHDCFKALKIKNPYQTYLEIVKRHNLLANTTDNPNNYENISDEIILPFGHNKTSLMYQGRKCNFINSRQLVICIQQLMEMQKITQSQGFIFLQWYTEIVDNAIEQWYIEKNEEDIQDKLIMLAGYSNIRLRQEFTILDITDSDKKTRRFDLVEFVNRTNLVRIRELKKNRITVNHIRDAIEKRCYIELASRNFPGKRVEFIFCSLYGIEEEAIDYLEQLNNIYYETAIEDSGLNLNNIYYEPVQDLGLRLYINALKNRPVEGWPFFQINVAKKFSSILPEQKLLKAAEERLSREKGL